MDSTACKSVSVPPGEAFDLRREEVREQYRQASKASDVEIASLAIGVLNRVPYSSDPNAEKWVEECVEVMPKMGQKVVLVAFFAKGDIKGKPQLQQEVIRRLKRVAPKAEKAGVVLGLETWLNADDHLRILDAVGSPAVQVYYDVANMTLQGYDIYREIRQLGRERICEFHCKENGFLLGKGRIDFHKVKQTMDEIGYSGWLIIESAMGKKMSMLDSYKHNQKYLRSIFPTKARNCLTRSFSKAARYLLCFPLRSGTGDGSTVWRSQAIEVGLYGVVRADNGLVCHPSAQFR